MALLPNWVIAIFGQKNNPTFPKVGRGWVIGFVFGCFTGFVILE